MTWSGVSTLTVASCSLLGIPDSAPVHADMKPSTQLLKTKRAVFIAVDTTFGRGAFSVRDGSIMAIAFYADVGRAVAKCARPHWTAGSMKRSIMSKGRSISGNCP